MFTLSEKITGLLRDLDASVEVANLVNEAYSSVAKTDYVPFGPENEDAVKRNTIQLYAADMAARNIVLAKYGFGGLTDARYRTALENIVSGTGDTTVAIARNHANLAWRYEPATRYLAIVG